MPLAGTLLREVPPPSLALWPLETHITSLGSAILLALQPSWESRQHRTWCFMILNVWGCWGHRVCGRGCWEPILPPAELAAEWKGPGRFFLPDSMLTSPSGKEWSSEVTVMYAHPEVEIMHMKILIHSPCLMQPDSWLSFWLACQLPALRLLASSSCMCKC